MSFEVSRSERPADRKAIDGVDINSGKIGNAAHQVQSLSKGLFFVFVAFNDGCGFPAQTVLGEGLGKPLGLPLVIFSHERPRHNSHFRTRRDNLAESKGIRVVCVDTDASESRRSCAVCVEPHLSGSVAGELLGKIVPPGSKVAVVAGTLMAEDHKRKAEGFSETFPCLLYTSPQST